MPALWFLNDKENDGNSAASPMTIAYLSVFFTLLILSFVVLFMKLASLGQKTRNPQQRRMYVGTRARPSLSQAEPTIYVSPANLPPPPKYEAMAPPSYEEVVGIHYPNYQATQIQPITQPITSAMIAQSSSSNATDNVRNNEATVITVTSEQRRSVVVASS